MFGSALRRTPPTVHDQSVRSNDMKAISQSVLRFLRDEEGATAIEYALMAALIAVVIAATVLALGGDVKNVFAKVSTCIKSPTNANCT